jgi:hypothetical protein
MTTTTAPAAPFAGLQPKDVDEMGEDFGRWLIHGPQGYGKTRLASTIAEVGPTLFIDLTGEKGVRSFKGAPYQHNIKVVRPQSITALDDLFWELAKGDHPYVATVVDSLTAAQKMSMRFMLGHDETAVREIRQGTAPADQRTWGQTLDIMTDTATFWYGLADADRPHPMHVVMTAQTRVDEDYESGDVRRAPDVQKGALSITLAAPDYILYTDVEENIDAVGDDTLSPVNFIVRFGANPGYRTKARLPFQLQGKLPPILGRQRPVSLTSLSRVLGVGGIPAAPKKTTAAKKTAASSTSTDETKEKEAKADV